jgi:hypothetical protein
MAAHRLTYVTCTSLIRQAPCSPGTKMNENTTLPAFAAGGDEQ